MLSVSGEVFVSKKDARTSIGKACLPIFFAHTDWYLDQKAPPILAFKNVPKSLR